MKKRVLKTMTLFSDESNPSTVVCPGHVGQKVFNQAFRAEGWKPGGAYKQKDLKYTYMVKRKPRNKWSNFRMKEVPPQTKGARPYTVTPWDQ